MTSKFINSLILHIKITGKYVFENQNESLLFFVCMLDSNIYDLEIFS